MTTAHTLASLPDTTRVSVIVGQGDITVEQLREAFTTEGPRYLTTEQASETFGFGPAYWRDLASELPGAVKGRHWLLPIESCEAHMKARANRRAARRADRTHANAAPASTPSARPQGLETR